MTICQCQQIIINTLRNHGTLMEIQTGGRQTDVEFVHSGPLNVQPGHHAANKSIFKKKCILCTFSRILIKIKKINYAELQRCLADAVQLCLRRYCWQYESIHLEDHSVSCFLEYNIAEGLIHIRWSSFWILINCTLFCQLQFLQPLELQELITLTSS